MLCILWVVNIGVICSWPWLNDEVETEDMKNPDSMLMKNILVYLLLVICLSGLFACSGQQSYEGYRQAAINECARQPTSTEYNRCVERANMSAEEYRHSHKN